MNKKYIVEADAQGRMVGQPQEYTGQVVKETVEVPVIKEVPPGWVTMTFFGMAIFAGVVFVFALFTMVNMVSQKTVRVIERFGKFKKTLGAGLGFKLPFIDSVVGELDLRIQQMNVNVETKTSDNVIINTVIAVQYFIKEDKAVDAFYSLKNPREQISSYVLDAVRAQIPMMTLDKVFESKEEIAAAINATLSTTLEKFGYEIFKSLVIDIAPNKKVLDAMNEIEVQKRTKTANIEKGEADKVLVVKKAEAEKEQAILRGQGIAGERKAIVEGLEQSVEEFAKKTGVTNKDVLGFVSTIQYLDTMKSMGENGSTIFMPSGANGANDILTQMTAALSAKDTK